MLEQIRALNTNLEVKSEVVESCVEKPKLARHSSCSNTPSMTIPLELIDTEKAENAFKVAALVAKLDAFEMRINRLDGAMKGNGRNAFSQQGTRRESLDSLAIKEFEG